MATLVSLSLTPLHIERILSVNLHAHQVSIVGTAILFDSDYLGAAATVTAGVGGVISTRRGRGGASGHAAVS